jgi:hypothetical protein
MLGVIIYQVDMRLSFIHPVADGTIAHFKFVAK